MATAGKSVGLAKAYAGLVAEGVPVTVVTLKERAGVSVDAAAGWLRENCAPSRVPGMPVGWAAKVWPLAYMAVQDVAVESVAVQLNAARDDARLAVKEAVKAT